MTGKTLVRSALAALAVAVLSACGAEDPAPAAIPHNEADIAFAQRMVPHHAQAVEMAELVPGRTDTPAVLAIAERVKAAQAPEIALMTEWLAAWGAPADEHGDQSAHGDHGAGMPGMMADADMAALRAATGEDFDQRWLAMMIVHHQGAIEMAEEQLAEGRNPDAQRLARQIVDAQRAEIREMQALLPQG
jgi:uncharacterized protein (DUF305 family)